MKPKSAKQKGRRLQNMLLEMVEARLSQPETHVRTAVMGESGDDLQVWGADWPYVVEAKNTERLQIWKALAQAEARTDEEHPEPLLFFKRNHSDIYAVVRAEHLLDLVLGERLG